MSKKTTRSGLGRGLASLIQNTAATDETDPAAEAVGSAEQPTNDADSPAPTSDPGPVTDARFAEVPVDAIRPNPAQPRMEFDEDELAELTASIEEVGLLQPIVVQPLGGGQYELVMGERRWRAHQRANKPTIGAIIRATEDHDRLRDALLENLHRVQLNPLEEAAAYQQMLDDFGCSQEELAGRIKRSRPQISNTLRLLKLPATVQRRVAAGVLSAGHARALLGVEDQVAREQLAQRIVAEGLSVRATEELVTLGESGASARRRAPRTPHPRAAEVARALEDRFDTRVKVSMNAKQRGTITLDFASADDLDRLLDLLTEQSAMSPK